MFPQNYRSLCILTLGLAATAATADILRAQAAAPAVVAPAVQAKRLVNVPSQVQGVVIEVAVKDGQRVKAGDVLARFDDRLAQLAVRRAKLQVKLAEYECKSAEATRGEAKAQLERILRLESISGAKVFAQEEISMKKLTLARIEEEVRARKSQIELARIDLEKAMIYLERYNLPSPVNGVVQRIQRRRGEAVRELETVIQIRSTD